MKLTLTKLSLALFAALTLSACSGGGGGGSSSDSHHPTPVNPTENKQPETLPKQSQDVPTTPKNKESQKVDEVKPSEGKTSSVDDAKQKEEDKKPSVEYPSFNNAYDEKSGVVFQLETNSTTSKMINKFAEKNINLLEVNGQTIELVPADKNVGEFSSKNENGVIHLIGSSENTRWGAIYSPNAKYDYVFAVGKNATKVENMPMDNQVSYVGKAVHLEGNESPIDRDATFTVNFGEKVLEGQISANNAQPIKLHAHIGGNGFEGMTEQGTSTRGGFYGENASELIGSYQSEDPNHWYIGAYGASKK